jgi:hypothetical protein
MQITLHFKFQLPGTVSSGSGRLETTSGPGILTITVKDRATLSGYQPTTLSTEP